MSVNNSAIEWTTKTWNPVTGCLNGCPYCYARDLANGRCKNTYLANNMLATPFSEEKAGDPFYPRFWPERLKEKFGSVPTKVFVCSMADLFGPWVPDVWISQVIDVVKRNPQHTFIFLTKYPENLGKWNPWPKNIWLGATATGKVQYDFAWYVLAKTVNASVRFISFEPLNGPVIPHSHNGLILDWIIIGAETGYRKGKPALSDVHKWAGVIIEAADKTGVPVFLKDNLKWPEKRQEWPA